MSRHRALSRPIGRLAQLWRYPIKSMGGERCPSLALHSRGIVGDRRFALQTPDGGLASGKDTTRFRRVDGLLDCTASGPPGNIECRLPDGGRIHLNDPDFEIRISGALNRELRLTEESTVSHLDDGAVHLVSSRDLAELGSAVGESPVDVRRFRPNLLLDFLSTEGFDESWVGSTLAVGPRVRLRIEAPTARCRMVGLAQGNLKAHSELEPHLLRSSRGCFGTYASVLEGGEVFEGDALLRVG